MVHDVPVKDAEGQEAFALVNKATGKAIKLGFGSNYLVCTHIHLIYIKVIKTFSIQ